MVILAVDDDPEDFEFFFDAVRKIDQSIIVLKATNGEEALALLEEHVLMPDYIFLDINMPLMDGHTCLQQIKKSERLRNIPVVMYSTTNNATEIEKFKLLGAKFLVKSHQFNKLVSSLSLILGYSNDRSAYMLFFNMAF
jgi:CheY-like chemotaxis protein